MVGRFAPSPSGRLHVGNILSFLVAELLVRQAGGHMVFRMEDLDPARSKAEFVEQIMRDMEWFGFSWEGEVLFQSARTEAYAQAFAEMERQGLVYPCFCTRADLHAARAPHAGEEYVYAGTCAVLSTAERAARIAAGEQHSWRVRVGENALEFEDGFQGPVQQSLGQACGDFIVRRADGVFAYQLAVVVDDAFQGVGQVVRGYDLLASTPRQMYLQRLLGLPGCEYAHVPLVVDENGVRLSKRNTDASLEYLIEQRKLSAAEILGHLAALCGIIPAYSPCTIDELVRTANLSALSGFTHITWTAPE